MADEEPAAAAEPLEEAAPPKEGGDVAPDEVAASGGAEAVEGAAVDTAEGEQTPELGGGDDEPSAATGEDGEDADEGTLAPADGDPEPAEEEYEEDEAVEPDDLGDEDDGYEGGEGYGDFDMLEAAEVDADEEQVEEDKSNLAELFKQAQEEKATFLDLNQVLQKKLAEHLRTSAKKMDESKDIEKSVTDQEQRYYKFLAQVNELRDELKRLQQQHDKTAMEMKRRLDDKQGKAEEIKAAFVEFKREILKGAENSRTSKPIPPKLIAAFENQESEKDEEVERVRLSNINRRNFLRKLENTLRQKEKLADGLHLIDFEQLKIENQTLNEKIEERNEELLKLRKKTTTTVQVLTHLKEKLQFVQAENQVRKQELSDFEVELTAKRDVLTQVKHERDALRAENAGRRQAKGLVSSEELLIDYETRRRAVINKKEAMAKLQHQYESIVSQTADLRRAIASAGGVV